MKKRLLFVYGTLLEGHGNWRYFLEGKSKKLGEHITEPEFTMLHLGGYPGVVPNGNTSIHGEVYEVDEPTFRSIDSLEGYYENNPENGLYNRQLINTPYGEAWIYIFNGGRRGSSYYNIIESGSWTKQ